MFQTLRYLLPWHFLGSSSAVLLKKQKQMRGATRPVS